MTINVRISVNLWNSTLIKQYIKAPLNVEIERLGIRQDN